MQISQLPHPKRRKLSRSFNPLSTLALTEFKSSETGSIIHRTPNVTSSQEQSIATQPSKDALLIESHLLWLLLNPFLTSVDHKCAISSTYQHQQLQSIATSAKRRNLPKSQITKKRLVIHEVHSIHASQLLLSTEEASNPSVNSIHSTRTHPSESQTTQPSKYALARLRRP